MALTQCPNCGASMSENAAACPKCGAARTVFCQECGAQVSASSKSCPNCGCPITAPQPNPQYQQPSQAAPKDKTIAGVLALLLGCLGIDLFYCGKNKAGLVVLLVFVCLSWTGLVWIGLGVCALIRCIRMFTSSQEDFEQRYVYTENEWPLV